MTNHARNITRTVSATRILLTVAEHRLPATVDALLAEIAAEDGYPTRDPEAPPSAGEVDVPAELRGGPTTPTEAMALRRNAGAERDLNEIARVAVELHRMTRHLEALVRRHSGEPVTADLVRRLQCANPTKVCRSIADPSREDGLCVEHGAEEDEKRRADTNARRQRRHAAKRGDWYGEGEPMAEFRGAAQAGGS